MSAVLNYLDGGPPGHVTGSIPISSWNGEVNRANITPGAKLLAGFDSSRFDFANTLSTADTFINKSAFANPAAPEWLPRRPGMWQLILLDSPDARSQLPFVQAALAQYEGLGAGVGLESPAGNIAYDWNLGAVRAFGGAPRGPGFC